VPAVARECPIGYSLGYEQFSRQAIEKLAPKERAELRQWLDAQDIEESPEFLAAVDKGIWSAENEPKSSLEDVMKRLEERFGWKLN
jgi:hypothetical protein